MEKKAKGDYTLIGEGTVITGEISVPHSIHIAGNIKGTVNTADMLSVGPTGVVEANIKAKSATISGQIIGNLDIEDRVELESKASLIGDIRARDLVINEGAVFQGSCTMESPDKKTKV